LGVLSDSLSRGERVKILTLALLLFSVTPIMASHEPMPYQMVQASWVEAIATGVTRFNESGRECEFEHEQYLGKHNFFVPCAQAALVNEYILTKRRVSVLGRRAPGPFQFMARRVNRLTIRQSLTTTRVGRMRFDLATSPIGLLP
jgi:hypothetical protein